MIEGNYDKIVEKISKSSGLEKEEIERRIEAKRAKLAGLISKEGAAQVIAAELGISFDNEKLKINELLSGMRKVNVVGKIINLFPVRSFTTKRKGCRHGSRIWWKHQYDFRCNRGRFTSTKGNNRSSHSVYGNFLVPCLVLGQKNHCS